MQTAYKFKVTLDSLNILKYEYKGVLLYSKECEELKKGIYEKYVCVNNKKKVIKQDLLPKGSKYPIYVTAQEATESSPITYKLAGKYDGLTADGKLAWNLDGGLNIYMYYTGTVSSVPVSSQGWIMLNNEGYHAVQYLRTFASGMRETVVYDFGVNVHVYVVSEDNFEKGSYLNDIIADYGSLPADGRHSDGFWYTFIKMASDLKVNVGGIWRDAPTGYSNNGGIWRQQSELKANVEGIFK